MQQDKKARIPVSSPAFFHRNGSTFKRPPVLLPLEEEHILDSDQYARADNGKRPAAVSTGRQDNGLPLLPDTDIPGGGIPDSFMLQQMSYDELDERLKGELDLSRMSTVRLMQLSGMMRAVRKPAFPNTPGGVQTPSRYLRNYEEELLGKTLTLPRVSVPTAALAAARPIPAGKVGLRRLTPKTVLGLVIGVVIIVLLSRFIDFKAMLRILEDHVTTPGGMLHVSVGALAVAMAFTLRGARWKLFLNRVSNVRLSKVIRIYWIAVFINFLLPVQGGEIAKCFMLKKVTGVPVSQSLPTVATDKALDLMPVLGLMVIAPFIPGIHMNITLWLILGFISFILVSLVIIVALTAWRREAAMHVIRFFMKLLPKRIGARVEGFGLNFVDSLIEGARRPKTFIAAAALTALAILCEGVFAWQMSRAVGLNAMGLCLATFGYSMFTMTTVLPTPPGQVGTNEGAKLLVFTSLLGFNKAQVLAMSILSHVVGPAVITTACLISLWSLGLTLSGVNGNLAE